ncbi:MAG: GTPase Era [Woeseiaceae bacterium]|nr:GTPase Era [Woeseiaceae bacterium]
MRCGFVAVVGRPNVGKSTLINALVGSKISIVTHKPQTTRHRILGVRTVPGAQLIFVDTPGLHRGAGKAMNRLMNRTATAALADADVALFVTEAARWAEEDSDVLERIRAARVPALAVLNKIDLLTPRERVLEALAAMVERYDFPELVPVSAKKRDNLDRLLETLPAYLPESPPLFPEEMRTDRPPEFRAAEVVREKLTRQLHQELPYGLTVQVERYAEEDGGFLVHAVIWVERESQKGIVVGKGGQVLKTVGRAARIELARELGRPVHLELWVKVRDNWSDNEQDLRTLGFDSS